MSERVSPKGKLDIAAVPDLVSGLDHCGEVDLCLDLGAVSALGTHCLQAILAASREAAKAGREFTIENVPDVVRAHMAAMGFTPESLAEGSA